MADVNLQPALERVLGQLLFQITALQAQNDAFRAELTEKQRQEEARLADALKPTEMKR